MSRIAFKRPVQSNTSWSVDPEMYAHIVPTRTVSVTYLSLRDGGLETFETLAIFLFVILSSYSSMVAAFHINDHSRIIDFEIEGTFQVFWAS
jgi:hypothetical protein